MPERDIESLGVMGWGLVAVENSSAAAVAVAVAVAAVAVAPGGGALILVTLRIGCAHYRHGIMLVVSYDYKTSVVSCS